MPSTSSPAAAASRYSRSNCSGLGWLVVGSLWQAAVLQRHVQGDHGHAQLLRLGGQDVARGIGEDTDHNNTSGLPVKYSIYNAFIKKVGNHYTTI